MFTDLCVSPAHPDLEPARRGCGAGDAWAAVPRTRDEGELSEMGLTQHRHRIVLTVQLDGVGRAP